MSTHASLASPVTGWFKSSRSNPSQNCVEVQFDGQAVHVRDSKDHGVGPTITVPAGHWPTILADVADGHSAASDVLRIERNDDGGARLRATSTNVVLSYTAAEWTAFVAGIVVGEFDQPVPAAIST